ncbi:MAG: hypothetical protein ACK4QW_18485 [Alphaproteobacteria bacterium]
MLEAVIARIAERVPALAGRVAGAADLAALMAAGALPAAPVSAHVIPLGLRAGPVSSATAPVHVQPLEETLAVVLVFRHAGAAGAGLAGSLRETVFACVAALAGWAPPESPGAFRLVRAGLVRMAQGTLVYQIDIAIDGQLRVAA